MDAQKLNMRDCFQRRQQGFETPRREEKRIAAGENDFANSFMLAQVIQRGFELVFRQQAAGRANMFASKAEATINRADEEWLEQGAVWVTVNDAG